MQDQHKTKVQLIEELIRLRKRVAQLEAGRARPHSESAPPDSQFDLSALPENTADRVWVVDRQYRLLWSNSPFRDKIRTTLGREFALGDCVLIDELPAEIRDAWRGYYDRALRGEKFSVEHTVQLTPQPQITDYWFTPVSVNDQIVGVAVAERDITDRKRIEGDLRRATEGLLAIFWHATVTRLDDATQGTGGFQWNNRFSNLDVVRDFLPLPDYPDDDLVARFCSTWLEEDRQAMDLRSTDALRRGLPGYTQEFRLRDANGNLHWMSDEARIRRLDDTHFEVVGFMTDITDRKQVEEALRASEQRYRMLIENQGEGVGLVDPDENFTFANLAAENLFGLSGLLVGHNLSEFVDPDQYALIKRETQARQHGHKSTYELAIHRPDGHVRQLLITAVPQFDEQGVFTGTFGVFRDITARKQAEDEARRLNLELEQRVTERTMELQTANEALQEDIRQRQRIEDMLRRSELRYRTLFESAGDAILILTLAGQIMEVNHTACQLYGYTPVELHQMTLTGLNMPHEAVHIPEQLRRLQQTGEIRFETAHRRNGGIPVKVDVNGRLIEYGGQPAVLAIVRDVTERRQIEETLRRSEATLAEAQRIAHFGSWNWDLIAGKLQCSDEMYRLVGLRPQEMEVTPEVFLKFLHPDEVEWILQKIQLVNADEPPAGIEHRLTRSNGEIRNVYSRVKVYRDENGSPLRLLGSTQDITDRKQTEQAVRQYADEQSALYEIALRLNSQLNTPELLQPLVEQAVTLLGAQSGGLYLYNAQQATLVLTQAIGFFSEYVGVTLKPGEGLSGRAFQTRQVMRVQDYRVWEGRADPFKADRRLNSLIAVPLPGKHSVLGVLIIADYEGQPPFSDHAARLAELFAAQAAIALENAQLHEQQQAQYRRLQDAQARLIQSEKMSALGRLIASISHEINNPLQAVQGCLTLVREGIEETHNLDPALAADWRHDLEVADSEVKRIAGIVQRLRDFYRPARAGWQTVDVLTTIDSVLALAAKQLQHSHIALEQVRPTLGPLVITTNADQLKQVILNLVLNAIDAMPGGGRLRVTTALEKTHAPARVRIDFADNGQGIAPENLPRIFEPFFTTKETGSGLGLSISYELIKGLGSDISVTSEAGRGSTFTLYLPLDAAKGPEVVK